MHDRVNSVTLSAPGLLLALLGMSLVGVSACDPLPVRVCRSSGDCLASEVCLDGVCVASPNCFAPDCPPPPPPPEICREDADCGPRGRCDIQGCPACAPGSRCACFGACVYPTDPCDGADERTCVRLPGCTPIYKGGCSCGDPDAPCDESCGYTFSHCAPAGCGTHRDARSCEAQPECDWVVEPVACEPCQCDRKAACECAPCPKGEGRCVPSQQMCPDVCAEVCAGRPEPPIPAGCPIPDCGCTPPPSCPDGQVLVNGRCERGCYGDDECGPGQRCTASEKCLSPPGCDGPDAVCPAVCYGYCAPDASSCYGLDPQSCIATAPCELVAVPEDCPEGDRNCAAYYECRPTTGRSCASLTKELECVSREDCQASRCGPCPDGADCICAEGAFLGCVDRDPCEGRDERSCLADQTCEPVYSGAPGCACPANDPTCDCPPPPPPVYEGCRPRGACFGAWIDENGSCRAPNDGAYPPECCAPLCHGLGEAQCYAARSLCQPFFTGGLCTCDETGACYCKEMTFQRCAPR